MEKPEQKYIKYKEKQNNKNNNKNNSNNVHSSSLSTATGYDMRRFVDL